MGPKAKGKRVNEGKGEQVSRNKKSKAFTADGKKGNDTENSKWYVQLMHRFVTYIIVLVSNLSLN